MKFKSFQVLSFFISQADVYDQTSKVLVEKVTTGYNATVFAYGATGSFNV